MDSCKMAASVETCEHEGIKSIGLAMIAGLTGDERRGNDVAVETISCKDTLKNEAGTGCLVTGMNRSLLGETPEEAADLHEVGRKCHHFFLALVGKDSSGDRIGMDIKTNKCYITHG
jgi:hypothetical protein